MGTFLIILGYLCYAFGVIDFAGMFFKYDLTGVSWSPILAGVIGYGLIVWGKKINEESTPKINETSIEEDKKTSDGNFEIKRSSGWYFFIFLTVAGLITAFIFLMVNIQKLNVLNDAEKELYIKTINNVETYTNKSGSRDVDFYGINFYNSFLQPRNGNIFDEYYGWWYNNKDKSNYEDNINYFFGSYIAYKQKEIYNSKESLYPKFGISLFINVILLIVICYLVFRKKKVNT